MKTRHLPLLLLCLGSFSCDKVKNLAKQARSAVEGKIAKSAGEAGDSVTDPELQKLVDQSPDGYVFRKDLPFPSAVEVKTTRVHELSGRFVQTSAIENQASTVKGTQTTVTQLARAGDRIRYTLVQSTFAEPVAEGADESEKPVVKQLGPETKTHAFRKSSSAWVADQGGGFRTTTLAQQLSPYFQLLMEDNALAPRPLWFGKKRFKIGDQVVIPDKSLAMLVAGDAKGSFTLTLESIGSVKGHPCGVFNVTGDYSRAKAPDFEGNLTQEDVTIQSGKFWLSLIYPLVLREETDTIQTTRSGSSGNAATRGGGSVKVSVIREWKKTGP